MALSLPPAFALASHALPPSNEGQPTALHSSAIVVEHRPDQKKVRGQVVASAAGEGWTVYDTGSQTPLSSQSFPPSVRFAGPACGLSARRRGESSRTRYIYAPIATHPTHALPAVREGRSVCVHTESEGKGGFGEALQGKSAEGSRPQYRTFDAAVLGVCVIPGYSDRLSTVAVVLASGEMLQCGADLLEVHARHPAPPAWKNLHSRGTVLRLRSSHPQPDLPTTPRLTAELLRPSYPPPSSSGSRSKKRKARSAEEALVGRSPTSCTCAFVSWKLDQPIQDAPLVNRLEGNVVDAIADDKGRAILLRSDGDLEVWRLGPSAACTFRVRLDPARLPSLNIFSYALCVTPSLSDNVVLFAVSAASEAPSILVLALDLQFGKILATSSTNLPASFASTTDSSSSTIAASASGDDAEMIVSVAGGGRQALQVQSISAPDSRPTAAVCLADPAVGELSARWLRTNVLGLRTQINEVIQDIKGQSLAAGAGKTIEDVLNLGLGSGDGQECHWTSESAAKAEQVWAKQFGLSAAKPKATTQATVKAATKAKGKASERSTAGGKESSVLSPKTVRVLVNACLSPRLSQPASPYPKEILLWLLRNGKVTNSMISDGVHRVLLRANDWDAILAATRYLPDLSDEALSSIVRHVLTEKPSLTHILVAVVARDPAAARHNYAALASALDTSQAIMVLRMALEWTCAYTSKDASKAAEMEIPKGTGARPSPPRVVALLEAILDAHSIALLQYEPAHDLLRQLAAVTEQWASDEHELVNLEGSLGAFSRHRQDRHVSLVARTRAKERLGRDNVKLDKGMGFVRGRLVNVRRAKAQEAHRQVGPYTIEKLDL